MSSDQPRTRYLLSLFSPLLLLILHIVFVPPDTLWMMLPILPLPPLLRLLIGARSPITGSYLVV